MSAIRFMLVSAKGLLPLHSARNSDGPSSSIAHPGSYKHRQKAPDEPVSAGTAEICYPYFFRRNMTEASASINQKDLFLRACRGQTTPRLPVWMMRQAGRYLPEYRELRAKHTFLEVCKRPDLAVEASLQPFRRLGVDAVIVFSDILIPAEAMGLPLELGDAGPNIPNPVRSRTDVEKLKQFDPETETGFLPEAIRRIVKSVGSEVPVLGFAAAPWTLACYMVEGKTKEGFAAVKSFLYHEPKTFRDLLHRIAQATIPYLKAQIAAGATAVQLFDTWCGELNLQDYEDFALPAVQEIIAGLSGAVPVIYYTKASQHLLPAVARSGAHVLSVDWRVDLAEIRNTLGPKIAQQGNVHPAVLFSPPEKIREATLGAINSLAGEGHILNLGHGILQHTPVENAQLFIETGQRALLHQARPAAQVR